VNIENTIIGVIDAFLIFASIRFIDFAPARTTAIAAILLAGIVSVFLCEAKRQEKKK